LVYTDERQREGKNLSVGVMLWCFPELEIRNFKLMISKIDRRSRQRVVARLPVRVRSVGDNAELKAETRDVSTNGVFLYTASALVKGSDVELVLILPPELTSGEKCWVCCHACVLRVEQGPGKSFGVAAEIRRIDVLPEIPMSS
jgi:hypothetical protein